MNRRVNAFLEQILVRLSEAEDADLEAMLNGFTFLCAAFLGCRRGARWSAMRVPPRVELVRSQCI